MEYHNKEKNDNAELKEVVYTPTNDDNREPKLLKAESEVKSDSVFLYISAFTADIIVFGGGCGLAWSSPVFPQLKQSDPNINPLGEVVTSLQESWIAALLCLGAAIGPLFAGKSADALGRKKTLLLIALPMLVSFIVLSFATSINLYYMARFAFGLGLGSGFAILPMYLGEITEDHNRGKFGCIMTVFVTLGLLYPFAVGPLLSVRLFSFSCAIPLALFLIFFSLFIPETPIYLASKGNVKGAEEALMKLRNKTSSQVQKELLHITQTLEKDSGQKGGIGDLFKNPGLRKGLIICVGLVIIQQFAGINVVIAFMGPIFEATGSSISSYVSTNLIGVIQVIATILTAAVVERLGRKILLLLSIIGSCVTILLLGLYFYLKYSTVYNVEKIFWLPVVCLMVYIVAFNTGLGSLPWAIMGEIFPSNVKSIASSLTSFSCFTAGFVVTLGFPILVEIIGMAKCFWLFGSCCIVGIVFIYALVPETKGKSLEEIQKILSNGR